MYKEVNEIKKIRSRKFVCSILFTNCFQEWWRNQGAFNQWKLWWVRKN